MESQCWYCGYTDKHRCRNPKEAARCSRDNKYNRKKPMGNHDIPCDHCGKDTRGLSGVKGCNTLLEAERCSEWQEMKRVSRAKEDDGFILKIPEIPVSIKEALVTLVEMLTRLELGDSAEIHLSSADFKRLLDQVAGPGSPRQSHFHWMGVPFRDRGGVSVSVLHQLRHLAHPLSEMIDDKTRLRLMIALVNKL